MNKESSIKGEKIMYKETNTTEALYKKLEAIYKDCKNGAAEEEIMAAINALWRENMDKYLCLKNEGV